MKIRGVVVSGLGEGSFFMSMPHYKKEIAKKAGFDAFPGTLNIKTKKNNKILQKMAAIRIEGFSDGRKKFGGANCYDAKIKNLKCCVIVPDLTRHSEDIIEIISPVHLRSTLDLKDNDKITVEL